MATTDCTLDTKKYELASALHHEWGLRLVTDLDLNGDERILDLGCGDGVLTAELAARVPRGSVVGIDPSAEMIEAARERRAPNLRFARMELDRVKEKEQYDLVVSSGALHRLRNHRRVLGAVRSCLRKGGTFRAGFAGEGNCANLLKVIRQVMALPRFAACFADFTWPWHLPSVTDYKLLLRQAGFKRARVWAEKTQSEFDDTGELIQWIDQPCLLPFLGRVPEEGRPLFRKLVIASMIRAAGQPDGRCIETFRCLNVLARK